MTAANTNLDGPLPVVCAARHLDLQVGLQAADVPFAVLVFRQHSPPAMGSARSRRSCVTEGLCMGANRRPISYRGQARPAGLLRPHLTLEAGVCDDCLF